MLFQKYEPLTDAPPGYWQHLATTWRQNVLLTLMGAAAAGTAWWTDSPLLRDFAMLMGGLGLFHLAMGGGVIAWRSLRFRRGSSPR